MDRVRWLLITSGGLGLSPVAPGTVGTFGGVAVALLVQWLVPDYAVLAWSAVAVLLFWWGCSQSEYVARTWPKKDPGAFVLDEVVGHLVTLITFVLLARTGALSEINRLQTSFPGRQALATLTIAPTQRGDGSSIFRIVTDEMPAEDAQRLCNELWGGMVSCMLRAANH